MPETEARLTEAIFRVGGKAVYPGHGVAEITGIECIEIAGQKQTFYVLKVLENGMKIRVPKKNVEMARKVNAGSVLVAPGRPDRRRPG